MIHILFFQLTLFFELPKNSNCTIVSFIEHGHDNVARGHFWLIYSSKPSIPLGQVYQFKCCYFHMCNCMKEASFVVFFFTNGQMWSFCLSGIRKDVYISVDGKECSFVMYIVYTNQASCIEYSFHKLITTIIPLALKR